MSGRPSLARPRTPPVLATWLVRWLYSGPHTDAVVGDLTERYQMTPSSTWYWRQALTTVAVSLLWEIRTHKVLAIRAVATGYASVWLLRFVLLVAARPLGPVIESVFGESRHIFFGTWGRFITLAGAGWIVGRLQRHNRGSMVLVFAAFMFLMDIPELHRRGVNAFADDRYVPAFRGFVSAHSLAMLGILLGGLSQAPPPRDDRIRR